MTEMAKVRVLVLAIATFLVDASLQAAEKPFEMESWPYEGMPYFRVLTGQLRLRSEPSSQAQISQELIIKKGSVVTFREGVKDLLNRLLKKGEVFGVANVDLVNREIVLDKSVQRATHPGLLRATRDGTFEGRVKGSRVDQTFQLRKNDSVEELLYLGEGFCVYRFQRKIIDTNCLLYDVENAGFFEQVSPGETEWWLHVTRNGVALGWLRMDDDAPSLELIETIK